LVNERHQFPVIGVGRRYNPEAGVNTRYLVRDPRSDRASASDCHAESSVTVHEHSIGPVHRI
jgi:hypothetical protein